MLPTGLSDRYRVQIRPARVIMERLTFQPIKFYSQEAMHFKPMRLCEGLYKPLGFTFTEECAAKTDFGICYQKLALSPLKPT